MLQFGSSKITLGRAIERRPISIPCATSFRSKDPEFPNSKQDFAGDCGFSKADLSKTQEELSDCVDENVRNAREAFFDECASKNVFHCFCIDKI